MGTPILRLVSGYDRIATQNLITDPSFEVAPANVEGAMYAATDDAEWNATTAFSTSASPLHVGHYSTQRTGSAWRFSNIQIPKNAVILQAYMMLTVAESSLLVNKKASFRYEDTANSSTFSNWANYSARTWQSFGPVWNMEDIVFAQPVPNLQTPSITYAIQQIVNKTGWFPGNSIAIELYDSFSDPASYISLRAFEYSPSATFLYVSYLFGGWAPDPSNTGINVQSTTRSTVGQQSLKQIASGNHPRYFYDLSATLSVGTTYTLSLKYYIESYSSGTPRINIYYDGTDHATNLPTNVLNEWRQMTVTFTPTSTAASAKLHLQEALASGTWVIYWDEVQLEVGTYATPYCDGDQPGCIWDGQPHTSTSTRTASNRTQINLLGSNFYLSTHRPQIAQHRDGGTFLESPFSDGRKLVDAKFDNVIETYELKAINSDQDAIARTMQNIRRLLNKASDYWLHGWNDEPVWLEAKASNETNMRYAIVHTGTVPEDENYWGTPFLQPGCNALMDGLTLIVERGHWLATEPGVGTPVQSSVVESFDTGVLGQAIESITVTDQPVVNIFDGANDANLEYWLTGSYFFHLNNTYIGVGCAAFCGFVNEQSWSGGFRFIEQLIPQGATINSATMYFTPSATNSSSITIDLSGHDVDSSGIFTTYTDFFTRLGQQTSAGSSWSPGTWTIDVESSVSVTSIVQEIVNRAGWSSGNAITIFWLDGGGYGGANTTWREVYSFDHATSSKHPRLVVSWS